MSTENETEQAKTPLSRGVLLIHRDRREGRADRFDIWQVLSTRTLKSGDVKAKLLSGSPTFSIDADATFKGGALGENWKVFALNASDKKLCFDRLPEPASAPSGTRNEES